MDLFKFPAGTGQPDKDKGPGNNGSWLTTLLWASVFLIILNSLIAPLVEESSVVATDYGTFVSHVKAGDVKQVMIEDGLIHYSTKDRSYRTGAMDDPVAYLRGLTGGKGFDDVLCYAPVAPVVTQSSQILGRDGCLNFFAGPTDNQFSAPINFYDVHYASTHVMGTTGGNTSDMIEALELSAAGRINPAVMVTHIGGLDAAAKTTCTLPKIPGGKKLIYTHVEMPLIALSDLRTRADEDPRYAVLADIVDANNGLWSLEAERYLLANW